MTATTLYMSLELSAKMWKLCFWTGGEKKRFKTVGAGELTAFTMAVAWARAKFGLLANCTVRSCYEAGRDGFWIHRFLIGEGIENIVVDPASIEVNRRQRRAKTDRLDALKLATMLYRYHELSETGLWKVVRVPSREEEDDRQLHRDMERLKSERRQHICRIKALLIKFGVRIGNPHGLDLDRIRDWRGDPLPPDTLAMLKLEQRRLGLVREQLDGLDTVRTRRIAAPRNDSDRQAAKLKTLRAVGPTTAWTLSKEFFGWRRFRNRRQVGALAGLTGTPYDSGDSSRDQGISKAGNKRVRALMVELAWGWVRLQPGSELTQWFMDRYGKGTKRSRRVGIVALARKLLVALWKYLEFDEIPAGAVLSKS